MVGNVVERSVRRLPSACAPTGGGAGGWIGPTVRPVRSLWSDDEEEDASFAMPAAAADRLRVDDRVDRTAEEVRTAMDEAEVSSFDGAGGAADVVVVVSFVGGEDESE